MKLLAAFWLCSAASTDGTALLPASDHAEFGRWNNGHVDHQRSPRMSGHATAQRRATLLQSRHSQCSQSGAESAKKLRGSIVISRWRTALLFSVLLISTGDKLIDQIIFLGGVPLLRVRYSSFSLLLAFFNVAPSF